MQRFNITITFSRTKQTSIKIQLEFHQEIAKRLNCLPFFAFCHFDRLLRPVPGQLNYFPIGQLWHGTTISITGVTIMAI